jgi:hypothetical protein
MIAGKVPYTGQFAVCAVSDMPENRSIDARSSSLVLETRIRLRGRSKTRQANPYSKRTGSRAMPNHACAMMPCVGRSRPQSTDDRR